MTRDSPALIQPCGDLFNKHDVPKRVEPARHLTVLTPDRANASSCAIAMRRPYCNDQITEWWIGKRARPEGGLING
jgi:hypothetical protein